MFSSEFVWCDLSTFDLTRAKVFYQNVFGWSAYSEGSAANNDYAFLHADSLLSSRQADAGVFTLPQFLQNIDMPSFWMSYVQVADLLYSVDLAVRLGAKCEVKPTQFDASSRFALIRDPSGAGFTLYEGSSLNGRDDSGSPGRMAWNELHVPNLELVEPFYRGLFGWDIIHDNANDTESGARYNIHAVTGKHIASILVLDESIKGPKNYWAVFFNVANMNSTLEAITKNNGSIVMSLNDSNGQSALVLDDQGAAFCLLGL